MGIYNMIKEIGNFINKNKLLFFMIIAYLLISASKETFKETFTSSGPQKTLSQRLEEINGYIANLESTIAQKTNEKNENQDKIDAVKQRAMTQPWYDVIKDKPTQLYAKLVVFDSANTPGYEDHVKALKTAISSLSSEQEKKETAEQEKETLVNTISALNDKLTQYKSEKLNLEVLSCSKCQTVNEVSDADKKL